MLRKINEDFYIHKDVLLEQHSGLGKLTKAELEGFRENKGSIIAQKFEADIDEITKESIRTIIELYLKNGFFKIHDEKTSEIKRRIRAIKEGLLIDSKEIGGAPGDEVKIKYVMDRENIKDACKSKPNGVTLETIVKIAWEGIRPIEETKGKRSIDKSQSVTPTVSPIKEITNIIFGLLDTSVFEFKVKETDSAEVGKHTGLKTFIDALNSLISEKFIVPFPTLKHKDETGSIKVIKEGESVDIDQIDIVGTKDGIKFCHCNFVDNILSKGYNVTFGGESTTQMTFLTLLGLILNKGTIAESSGGQPKAEKKVGWKPLISLYYGKEVLEDIEQSSIYKPHVPNRQFYQVANLLRASIAQYNSTMDYNVMESGGGLNIKAFKSVFKNQMLFAVNRISDKIPISPEILVQVLCEGIDEALATKYETHKEAFEGTSEEFKNKVDDFTDIIAKDLKEILLKKVDSLLDVESGTRTKYMSYLKGLKNKEIRDVAESIRKYLKSHLTDAKLEEYTVLIGKIEDAAIAESKEETQEQIEALNSIMKGKLIFNYVSGQLNNIIILMGSTDIFQDNEDPKFLVNRLREEIDRIFESIIKNCIISAVSTTVKYGSYESLDRPLMLISNPNGNENKVFDFVRWQKIEIENEEELIAFVDNNKNYYIRKKDVRPSESIEMENLPAEILDELKNTCGIEVFSGLERDEYSVYSLLDLLKSQVVKIDIHQRKEPEKLEAEPFIFDKVVWAILPFQKSVEHALSGTEGKTEELQATLTNDILLDYISNINNMVSSNNDDDRARASAYAGFVYDQLYYQPYLSMPKGLKEIKKSIELGYEIPQKINMNIFKQCNNTGIFHDAASNVFESVNNLHVFIEMIERQLDSEFGILDDTQYTNLRDKYIQETKQVELSTATTKILTNIKRENVGKVFIDAVKELNEKIIINTEEKTIKDIIYETEEEEYFKKALDNSVSIIVDLLYSRNYGNHLYFYDTIGQTIESFIQTILRNLYGNARMSLVKTQKSALNVPKIGNVLGTFDNIVGRVKKESNKNATNMYDEIIGKLNKELPDRERKRKLSEISGGIVMNNGWLFCPVIDMLVDKIPITTKKLYKIYNGGYKITNNIDRAILIDTKLYVRYTKKESLVELKEEEEEITKPNLDDLNTGDWIEERDLIEKINEIEKLNLDVFDDDDIVELKEIVKILENNIKNIKAQYGKSGEEYIAKIEEKVKEIRHILMEENHNSILDLMKRLLLEQVKSEGTRWYKFSSNFDAIKLEELEKMKEVIIDCTLENIENIDEKLEKIKEIQELKQFYKCSVEEFERDYKIEVEEKEIGEILKSDEKIENIIKKVDKISIENLTKTEEEILSILREYSPIISFNMTEVTNTIKNTLNTKELEKFNKIKFNELNREEILSILKEYSPIIFDEEGNYMFNENVEGIKYREKLEANQMNIKGDTSVNRDYENKDRERIGIGKLKFNWTKGSKEQDYKSYKKLIQKLKDSAKGALRKTHNIIGFWYKYRSLETDEEVKKFYKECGEAYAKLPRYVGQYFYIDPVHHKYVKIDPENFVDAMPIYFTNFVLAQVGLSTVGRRPE